ncbi:carboxypeptidase-like regulatory domain-containing protein [Niabella sp. W65]|nr:carboxypeptidase-like regulatory domain-containing protein [Niabella sp. W65]MCH7361954.1 carboxypeptidase-like regulatory domain-containing protein [Niabella sp. W65]ULT45709.1 carboxypeptidase-like regulatory domain-containing protein [Niabella sp. I65]
MRKITVLFLTFQLLFMLTPQAYGQSRNVNGTVTSDDQVPLAGVTIKVQGTDIAVMSNDLGKFTVKATTGQVLELSFIGYENRTYTVGDANDISIVLPRTTTSLEDVVVVGYGTQRRGNLTGAVSTVNVEKTLQGRPIADVGRGLQELLPD